MKIKITTAKLLELVAAARRRELDEYAERRAAYPAEVDAYRERVVTALTKEHARLARGGRPPESYGHWSRSRNVAGVVVDVGALPPEKPTRPDVTRYDRRLRELRLETRDELLIDVNDRDWKHVL